MAYRVNKNAFFTDDSLNKGWQRLSMSKELGECYVDRFALAPGLSIAYSSYTPNRDIIEESIIERRASTFSLTYGLEGLSCYRSKNCLNEDFVFSSNHTTLSTFGNSSGERLFKANQKVSQLRILIDGRFFEDYDVPFECDTEKIPTPKQHWRAKTANHTQYYINRLMALMMSSHTERPLEKKILTFNLLSEQLSLLGKNFDKEIQKPSINRLDELKLIKAKSLMIRYMSEPLTLAYIGKQVGLSESKLKSGFKAVYQISPYKMLLEIRMNKAWELLEAGNQVAQTAYAVGYQHPSNFSTAFSRFFGQAPKSLSKK
ncbi:helix-turn-helix domain-containing protein [Oceanospirillum linum]|nr:AraC family transcriptional regulator [Oceanospirillum linum]SEG44125.1 AraC-type DNA-binding protein [Oleiphilus messinensis]SMP34269.1 AraC-type DNA-binding protein [Oceanospirillum linum]